MKTAKKVYKIESPKDTPFVVLSLKEYESLQATLEELSDREAVVAIQESMSDVMSGNTYSHEEVIKLLNAK